jgi:lysylphosphatidylglycerol synthetase-like protein (DUF2156 family)
VFDFYRLSDWQYLVEVNPSPDFVFKKLFLVIFGLIILCSVVLWMASRYLIKKSDTLRIFFQTKVFYLLLSLGIGGIVLTFFRIVGASYISIRLIFLLFLIAMLAWAIYLIFYLIVSFPKEYREEIDQRRREKYLPKRK